MNGRLTRSSSPVDVERGGRGGVVPASSAALSGGGPRPEALPRCDGIRVLVVDDDPDGRELIALLLRDAGAGVTVAASATEALRALGSARPDVLISDLAMPEIDGYELIRRVRSSAGGAGTIFGQASL